MPMLRYNNTVKNLMDGVINQANLRLVLLSPSAVFDPTDSSMDEATNSGAWEVDGNGWTIGGEPLPNFANYLLGADEGMADFDDITKMAAGGTIGPAAAILITDGVVPLFFQQFGTVLIAEEGTKFFVHVNANGLYRILNP